MNRITNIGGNFEILSIPNISVNNIPNTELFYIDSVHATINIVEYRNKTEINERIICSFIIKSSIQIPMFLSSPNSRTSYVQFKELKLTSAFDGSIPLLYDKEGIEKIRFNWVLSNLNILIGLNYNDFNSTVEKFKSEFPEEYLKIIGS